MDKDGPLSSRRPLKDKDGPLSTIRPLKDKDESTIQSTILSLKDKDVYYSFSKGKGQAH